VTSHEVRCTSEFCLQCDCGAIGLRRAARSRCFQHLYRGLSHHRPPYPCGSGFILSCAPSSSEYVTAPFPHTARRLCAPSVRFCSPSRHEPVKSTIRRDSHPRLCSALSVSHALDGLLLHRPCKLVSSCSHVRDSLFRGCFPLPSPRGSSPRSPLVSLTTFASSQVAPTVQLRTSQLQGVDPGSDSSRRAGGLDLLTTRSPLEFSTPAGVSSNTLAPPSRRLRS
jgi:hypothetical protein